MFYERSLVLADDFQKRFWAKVAKAEGCWQWVGNAVPDGYGTIGITRTRRVESAHRASYVMHYGEIPDGLCVCHTCDNPGCVRPDHLWLGTHKQNMEDKAAKNRARRFPGSTNPNAKLTDEQRDEIRRRFSEKPKYAKGSAVLASVLAEEFGVSLGAVYQIGKEAA